MQLIVAEKPSVARDLARVLGVRPRGPRARFEGNGPGHHLVRRAPGRAGRAGRLRPALEGLAAGHPADVARPLPAAAGGGRRATSCRRCEGLLRDGRFTEVVNACDAGREGELIFRYVYELCGGRLPVRRLWISSLTDEAIRRGFAALRPGASTTPLADAARCRSEADWLVGLNATRAVTVRHRTGGDSPLYSIGRVQTPTLALVVGAGPGDPRVRPARLLGGAGHVHHAPSGGRSASFEATFRHQRRARLASAGRWPTRWSQRLDAHAGPPAIPQGPVVERVQQKTVREPPPLLFDLTSLQRTANRRFGLSAARTLEIAQALYETHKVLTYPRTDSRYLSRDLAATLPRLFRALAPLPDVCAVRRSRCWTTPDGNGAPARRQPPGVRRRQGRGPPRHHPDGQDRATGTRWTATSSASSTWWPGGSWARSSRTPCSPRPSWWCASARARRPEPAARQQPRGPRAERAARGRRGRPDRAAAAARSLPRPRARAAGGRLAGGGRLRRADADKGGGQGAARPRARRRAVAARGPARAAAGRHASRRWPSRPARRPATPRPRCCRRWRPRAAPSRTRSCAPAMKDTGLGTPATRAATIETLIKRGFIVARGQERCRPPPPAWR